MKNKSIGFLFHTGGHVNRYLRALSFAIRTVQLPIYRNGRFYRTVLKFGKEIIRPEKIDNYLIEAQFEDHASFKAFLDSSHLMYDIRLSEDILSGDIVTIVRFRWYKSEPEAMFHINGHGGKYPQILETVVTDEISSPFIKVEEVEI